MTLFLIAVIATPLMAIAFYFGLHLTLIAKSHTSNQKMKKLTIAVMSLGFLLLFIGVIPSIYMIAKAENHGATNNNIKEMSIKTVNSYIDNTPIESSLFGNMNDMKGYFIIYYKFESPDCKEVYKSLSEKIKNKVNIYWISTQSPQGEELLKTYSVDEVPSGVYIMKNPKNKNNYVKKTLYKTRNGKVVLDKENLSQLLELKSEEE